MAKYLTQKQLEKWAGQQIDRGVPMQTLWQQLMSMLKQPGPSIKSRKFGQHVAYIEACSNIAQIMLRTMVDRNNQAKQLEKTGNIDQAIALLEMNVRDLFDGTFPYNRLRIIYTKQKRYHDAIRICQAYINNPHTGHGEPFQQQIIKLQEKLK